MNSLCITIQISIFIYYVYDFTLMILFYMRKAHFSIGWCVFSFGLGGFSLYFLSMPFGSGKNRQFWCCTFLLYMVLLHFSPQYSVSLLYYSTFLQKKMYISFLDMT